MTKHHQQHAYVITDTVTHTVKVTRLVSKCLNSRLCLVAVNTSKSPSSRKI